MAPGLTVAAVPLGGQFGEDDLSMYDDGGTWSPIEEWMRLALIDALVDVGCPPDVAPSLVQHAALRTGHGVQWQLDVLDVGYWSDQTQVSQEEFTEEAAPAIAQMMRDQSAEAVDRRCRGEDWPAPYWDMPDRRRRQ